jgi:hypothetical protein
MSCDAECMQLRYEGCLWLGQPIGARASKPLENVLHVRDTGLHTMAFHLLLVE